MSNRDVILSTGINVEINLVNHIIIIDNTASRLSKVFTDDGKSKVLLNDKNKIR